ncbi:MAG: hypothetical protein K9J17_11255 [Flavobacteriales bacterium]|nr:hypothetical protein [Flavobacteriales bacterium]
MRHHALTLTTVILLLGALNSNAQDNNVFSKYGCESGETDARSDIENGTLKQFLTGDGIDYRYQHVLNTEYGIETQHVGCDLSDYILCYNAKMNEIIFEKFDKNIYKTARRKSESVKVSAFGKNN